MRQFLLIGSTLVVAALPCGQSLEAQIAARSDAARIYRTSSPAVFLVEVRGENGGVEGIGSAFLVDSGLLITNAHVVKGGKPFLKTGAVALPLSVERVDPIQDLAVLRSATPLEAAPLHLSHDEPAIGSPVFVVGNPQGLERSISEGIVSGIRTLGSRRLLQLTAAVSPGSSGGPVLSQDGAVVGVTVGYLEGGQNLNFAVPSAAVHNLLARAERRGGFDEAFVAVREVLARPTPEAGDTAAWRMRGSAIEGTLTAAAAQASSGADWLQLAVVADSAYRDSLAVQYAAQAVHTDKRLADSARAVVLDAWKLKIYFVDTTNKDDIRGMLAVADSQLAHRPRDTEALIFRARALDKLGRGVEAIAAARRAVSLGAQTANIGGYWTVYHDAVGRFSQATEDDDVFAQMSRAGYGASYDWGSHAKHLEGRHEWARAGDAYAKAYRLTTENGSEWATYACSAGQMYLIGALLDRSLDALRTCIDAYGRAAYLDTSEVASAHRALANILNQRNVFAQSEVHARQALVLNPEDAWAALELSRALEGLQRPTEAAATAEEAVRLSDGRYSSMHFQVGSAYFDLKDWSRCARAYEKAAELAPTDDAAPYNAALCLAQQGYYVDAARWMEQVLIRNPNRADRAEIRQRIAIWRR